MSKQMEAHRDAKLRSWQEDQREAAKRRGEQLRKLAEADPSWRALLADPEYKRLARALEKLGNDLDREGERIPIRRAMMALQSGYGCVPLERDTMDSLSEAVDGAIMWAEAVGSGSDERSRDLWWRAKRLRGDDKSLPSLPTAPTDAMGILRELEGWCEAARGQAEDDGDDPDYRATSVTRSQILNELNMSTSWHTTLVDAAAKEYGIKKAKRGEHHFRYDVRSVHAQAKIDVEARGNEQRREGWQRILHVLNGPELRSQLRAKSLSKSQS